jgi:1,4-dihydroxy-2-naphthoate octaprenyltransferase
MKKWLGVIRAPFLVLVPACLAPAFAVAYTSGTDVQALHAILIVVAGLAAQIAVNALNEYEDFRSGLDFSTDRTPFSGGSGTLVEHGDFASTTFRLGLSALALVGIVGVYFVWQTGWALVLPGVLGLVIIVAYSRWINRLPLLCLLAPGLGFGLLMVNLAVFVLTGNYQAEALALAIPVALLASNLLLLNQFPDIEADRQVGRRHFLIVYGSSAGVSTYIVLGAMVYLITIVAVVLGALPLATLLALLTLPLAFSVWRGLIQPELFEKENLIPLMARNVVITLTTPLLLAAGIALG